MMQVPHRLGEEILGVIYMDLQTSTLELAFKVELGKSTTTSGTIAIISFPQFAN